MFDLFTANDPQARRAAELRDLLNEYNHQYYVLNEPTISDYDFDMLMKELETIETERPDLDDPLSPTHRVGSDINKAFTQARHIYPMLSLANTYSIGEVDEWFARVSSGLMGEEFTVVGEMKFDGTSISLIYENGRLVRAVTRGDGEKGDVVTENVKTIRSIPLTLHGEGWPEKFEIRGEIVLPWKSFDRLNEERAYNEEPLFANPRNAASGTLKLQNSAEVGRRGLDAYFYYLLSDNLPYDNHYDNMMAAKTWGFKVSKAMTLLRSLKEVDEYINYWDTARKELPVATDGLVFKVNNLRHQLNLGYTAKSPRWAIAYKFQAERALTQLRFVTFEVGRTGVITPVANLDPVLLSGTVVKRASLHNEDIIRNLDIHDGDMLYVEKGGEIIPKITGVDIDQRQPGAQPIKFVTECPACGTTLTQAPGEAAWTCPNKYGCPPQNEGRVEHFVGRRMMNIDGIGEEIVHDLFEAGYVKNPADLYDLTENQIASFYKKGDKIAAKTIAAIQESKDVPFERVLYALSIPYVGETGAKKIARAARNIDRLMAMTHEQLMAIDDVGPNIAHAIIEYFADHKNLMMIERLRQAGLQFAVKEEEGVERTDRLQGKAIVISGTFTRHSRDEYKKLIEQHGGRNVGSISKKTDLVFAGQNMGPAKLEKATSLGIPIIDEDKFLEMIGENQ